VLRAVLAAGLLLAFNPKLLDLQHANPARDLLKRRPRQDNVLAT